MKHKKIVFSISLIILLSSYLNSAPVVVGYWHNWNNASAPAIKLADVPSYYNVVCIAFVESTSPSDMAMKFSVDPQIESEQQFIADIKTLQARGTKVLISMGGQNGTVILSSETEKQKFITSMDAIIKKYGFNGIDIDLENGDIQLGAQDTDFKNPVSPRLVNLIDAIKTLRNNNGGSNFWITAAPEVAYVQGGISAFAGIWGAYLPVLYALRDVLTYVHVQYYNCGGNLAPDGNTYNQGTADFIVAMTDMLLAGFNLGGSSTNVFPPFREDQVAFGLPAVPSAAGGGYTPVAEVKKALDYLTKGISYGGKYKIRKASGYPGLRGIMTWSINWDKTNNYEFGKTFSAYFNIATNINFNSKKYSGTDFPTTYAISTINNIDISNIDIYDFKGRNLQANIFLKNNKKLCSGIFLIKNNSINKIQDNPVFKIKTIY
jgi:chitinase